MDRGKRPSKMLAARNSKIYMDLKDIIRESALPFLPAKSLFRFQGVCRDWKLQIASPFFAHNQSLAFRAVSGLFYQPLNHLPSFISLEPNSYGVPDPSLKFLPVPVHIRSSSNGLLCCQGITGDKAYYICNPVTWQWKKLPIPSANHGPDPSVVLVYEPSLLDFEAVYRLICAFPSSDFDGATEFEIYSSKEGSWRTSGEICFARWKVNSSLGVHVNGVIYWQANQGGIHAFDLAKERLQVLSAYHHGLNACLGLINGKLSLAYATGRTLLVNVLANVHQNTMQMTSHQKMWAKKYHIHLDSAVFRGDAYENAQVLCLQDDWVLIEIGKALYTYDLKTGKVKERCKAPEYGARCLLYVNSLVYI
ncbi:hypothetical protein RJ639_016283 [Escallonia herrerae]|uniref:F-box associated beta-propeller type 1 domain-containing protein n=1 Tax=Escallonia herrerae TaxID=1293975 RepID=A0AA88VEC3_9ASTE|nr:hypothetical protein RJ639_016283 [Escallonia herrerae]